MLNARYSKLMSIAAKESSAAVQGSESHSIFRVGSTNAHPVPAFISSIEYLLSSLQPMPARTSFCTLFIILGYVIGVLIVAALLAPVLFFAAQSVMQHSPDSALSQVLADKDFAAYFSRAAMLAALIGLVPLLRLL